MIYRIIKGKKVLFGEVNKIDTASNGLQVIEKDVSVKLDDRNYYNLARSNRGLRYGVREFNTEQEFLDLHERITLPDGLYIIWGEEDVRPLNITLHTSKIQKPDHKNFIWYGNENEGWQFLIYNFGGNALPKYLSEIKQFTLNVKRSLEYSIGITITTRSGHDITDILENHHRADFLADYYYGTNQHEIQKLRDKYGNEFIYTYTLNFNQEKIEGYIKAGIIESGTRFDIDFWYEDFQFINAILPCINKTEEMEWPKFNFWYGQLMPESGKFGESIKYTKTILDNKNLLTAVTHEDITINELNTKMTKKGNIVFITQAKLPVRMVLDNGIDILGSEFGITLANQPEKVQLDVDGKIDDYLIYKSIESVDHEDNKSKPTRHHTYNFKF